MSDEAAPPSPMRLFFARLRHWVVRVEWMMLFPAVVALSWGFGQTAVAMVLVAVLPVFLALDQSSKRVATRQPPQTFTTTGRVIERGGITATLDMLLSECERRRLGTALLVVHITDMPVTEGHWGSHISGHIMDNLLPRVARALRDEDRVIRSAEDGLVVILAPGKRTDLDFVLQVADRVQCAIGEGIPLNGRITRAQSCIGLCTRAAAPAPGGEALLTAAECALRIARRAGRDVVRAFDPDMQVEVEVNHQLAAQVAPALHDSSIRPWFQPQIDANTGAIVGMEALARWHHPDLGTLGPDRFMPALSAEGLLAELGDRMLDASLAALSAWNEAGLHVPTVGINVSLEELSDPRLADRMALRVDQYDLAPNRVAIEILETVTLRDGDQLIGQNIDSLKQAGFRLDLDDFGTGAASIAHIAQFGVHRIKIDRSFVQNLAENDRRQRVIAAVLTLANQLDIETLAEGVETAEQHEILSRLGCTQLQGYGIARPMPFEDASRWLHHRQRSLPTPLGQMMVRGTA